MKTIKRFLCLISIFIIAASFAGCSGNGIDEGTKRPAPLGKRDEVSVDGYYLRLINDVYDSNGITERNYYICSDKECTKAVGNMVVKFDEKGFLSEYNGFIGLLAVEKTIYFTKKGTSYYYTETTFSTSGSIEKVEWENVMLDSGSGIKDTCIGIQSYYKNGKEHDFREEKYTDNGTKEFLSSVTERSFDEDGRLISEKTTNYDSDGKENK